MTIFPPKHAASAIAKLTAHPTLFIYFGHVKEDFHGVLQACPILKMSDLFDLLEGVAIIQCEHMGEATNLFHQVKGDRGPTRSNPYDGEVCVYAAIFGADGAMLDENS